MELHIILLQAHPAFSLAVHKLPTKISCITGFVQIEVRTRVD